MNINDLSLSELAQAIISTTELSRRFKNAPEPLQMSHKKRDKMAEETDSLGEGMYQYEKVLTLSDFDLSKAYLDALSSYAQSQMG